MPNLENISYTQVTHPSLITYSDWRNSLRPNYKIVYRDILLGYAALIAILLLSTFFPAAGLIFFVLKIGFCSLLLGLLLAYLSLFLHEAGHYNLHANKKTNDRLAMILL